MNSDLTAYLFSQFTHDPEIYTCTWSAVVVIIEVVVTGLFVVVCVDGEACKMRIERSA